MPYHQITHIGFFDHDAAGLYTILHQTTVRVETMDLRAMFFHFFLEKNKFTRSSWKSVEFEKTYHML